MEESRLVNIEDAIAALAKARAMELLGDHQTKYDAYLGLAEREIKKARR